MPQVARGYPGFLERLQAYERIEPLPYSRRPDKLAAVRWLLERLSHPERTLRVAHVAGTNGKGMTSAMLAALLGAAGHRVGLYTSPHVVDLRERIALDGALISEAACASAGHAVLDAADSRRAEIYFSYFDVLTAIGLLAFHEGGCAWAVLETGMGGLADATNAVDKRIAILTRIGFDHMYVLGNTLQEIAAQKLGIVRAGVPTVLGDQEPGLGPWMEEQIRARGSTALLASEYRIDLPGGARVQATWPDGGGATAALPGASLTRVKALCAANAVCAAEAVLGPALGADRAARLHTAMAVELPGRLERRFRQRIADTATVLQEVVLDGGHNAGALAALDAQLAEWGLSGYTLVIGLQADKLVPEVLPPVARLLARAAQVIVLAPQTARAPTTEALTDFLRSVMSGQGAAPIAAVGDARAALLAAAHTPERPLVATGSFWMLGDVMRLLEPA